MVLVVTHYQYCDKSYGRKKGGGLILKWIILSFGLFVVGAGFADPREGGQVGRIQVWGFDAFVGKKKIGRHTFEVETSLDQIKVKSFALFDYEMFGIPLFNYDHTVTEIYDRQLCLYEISSSTTTRSRLLGSGKQKVYGAREQPGFLITGSNEELIDSKCLMSFAYWTSKMLSQKQLLNAQDGKVVGVSIALKREDEKGKTFVLKGEGMEIELLYSVDDQWIGLTSKLRMGRRLIYALSDFRDVDT